MQIALGSKIKDRITGFEGVVTGRCEYITGCNQVLVQPPVDKEGAFVENRWLDEDRCQVDTCATPLTLKIDNPGFDKPAPRR